jgi:hypothetical protein
MLPCALLLILWLFSARESSRARLWLAALILAAGMTLTSKVAFIGWGVGIPSLDFTGVSGHSMVAALIWPVLLSTVAVRLWPDWRRAGVIAGYGIAVLVAVSRVVVGAHSPSEVLAGMLLGGLASGMVLRHGRVPLAMAPAWLSLSLAAWLIVVPPLAPASGMHGLVIRLALMLSNHSQPYTRMHLRRHAELPNSTAPDHGITRLGLAPGRRQT